MGGGGGEAPASAAWPRFTLPVTLAVFFLGLWWSARAAHHYRVWYMRMKDDAKAKDLLAKRRGGGGEGTGTAHEDAVVKAACPFAKVGGGGKTGTARCPVSGNIATDVAATAAEDLGAGKTTSTVLEPGHRDGYNPHEKDGTDEGEIMQAPSAPAKDTFYRTNSGTLQTAAPAVPPRPTRRRPRKAS